MKKALLAIAFAAATASAYAATAYHTGGMQWVTTVTGERGVSCEYNYAGRRFWTTFKASYCPNSIEV